MMNAYADTSYLSHALGFKSGASVDLFYIPFAQKTLLESTDFMSFDENHIDSDNDISDIDHADDLPELLPYVQTYEQLFNPALYLFALGQARFPLLCLKDIDFPLEALDTQDETLAARQRPTLNKHTLLSVKTDQIHHWNTNEITRHSHGDPSHIFYKGHHYTDIMTIESLPPMAGLERPTSEALHQTIIDNNKFPYVSTKTINTTDNQTTASTQKFDQDEETKVTIIKNNTEHTTIVNQGTSPAISTSKDTVHIEKLVETRLLNNVHNFIDRHVFLDSSVTQLRQQIKSLYLGHVTALKSSASTSSETCYHLTAKTPSADTVKKHLTDKARNFEQTQAHTHNFSPSSEEILVKVRALSVAPPANITSNTTDANTPSGGLSILSVPLNKNIYMRELMHDMVVPHEGSETSSEHILTTTKHKTVFETNDVVTQTVNKTAARTGAPPYGKAITPIQHMADRSVLIGKPTRHTAMDQSTSDMVFVSFIPPAQKISVHKNVTNIVNHLGQYFLSNDQDLTADKGASDHSARHMAHTKADRGKTPATHSADMSYPDSTLTPVTRLLNSHLFGTKYKHMDKRKFYKPHTQTTQIAHNNQHNHFASQISAPQIFLDIKHIANTKTLNAINVTRFLSINARHFLSREITNNPISDTNDNKIIEHLIARSRPFKAHTVPDAQNAFYTAEPYQSSAVFQGLNPAAAPKIPAHSKLIDSYMARGVRSPFNTYMVKGSKLRTRFKSEHIQGIISCTKKEDPIVKPIQFYAPNLLVSSLIGAGMHPPAYLGSVHHSPYTHHAPQTVHITNNGHAAFAHRPAIYSNTAMLGPLSMHEDIKTFHRQTNQKVLTHRHHNEYLREAPMQTKYVQVAEPYRITPAQNIARSVDHHEHDTALPIKKAASPDIRITIGRIRVRQVSAFGQNNKAKRPQPKKNKHRSSEIAHSQRLKLDEYLSSRQDHLTRAGG